MATPTEIVERLRSDPDAYAQAKASEGEAWGDQFTDLRLKQVRADDRSAALQLRPSRQGRAFRGLAADNSWHFGHGLSLACGSGEVERELVKIGICDSFVGVDVSEPALAEAREAAAELPIEYRSGDLNRIELGRDEFDVVLAQNCLHHVLELEHLADEIWRCLKPGGLLWISDYIGETQFQWTEERLRIINEVLAILPAKYRNFRLHNFTIEKVERPEAGNLASPFEAIRSAEILPVFLTRFDVEWRSEYDALIHLLCPVGARANYVESEDGPVLFEFLMLLDRLLVETKILSPLSGQYVMRKRA